MSGENRKFRCTYSLQLYALLSEGSFLIVGVCLLVAGVIQGDDALWIIGALITAATLPFVALMGSAALRPMVLTDEFLQVPGAVRSRRIYLGDIAGVGLLYREGVPSGWFLEAWDFTGTTFEIDRMAIITGHRDRKAPQEDAGELAHSRAGEAAKEIYERALARQGPEGPLARQGPEGPLSVGAIQAVSDATTLAWWSPDGTMGRVGGR